MKLQLKNTPEQVELIKAMGSKNQLEAREAQEAFAAFLGPVIQQVINQAGTAGAVYTDAPFDEDDSPSYPLDLYYNDKQNHISVWSQSMAGGLPSSHVAGAAELKIATYRLDSAVNMLRKYARRARLDVVSKSVERMSQEVLVKQERNAWAVILKALQEASTTVGGAATDHVIDSAATGGVFQMEDMNKLMTHVRRLNESFAGGTPDNAYSQGLTDLYMSPEMMEQVRGFAYQPMNTRNGKVGGGSDTSTSVALPDSVREDIFRSAGASEIYGVALNELLELGNGKKYVTLYNELGTNDVGHDLIIGLDNSKGAFIRPVAVQAESGGTFTALADDQWSQRSEKLGFYGFLEEGRVCIDSRAIVGLNVQS
tara:strand:+ start:18622 stop:19728 length:1107 start_codon:yes stop_codon:yes gene_type:complete